MKIRHLYRKKIFLIILGLLVISSIFFTSNNAFLIDDPSYERKSIIKDLNQSNDDSWNREWELYSYGKIINFDSEENIIIGCGFFGDYALVKYNSSGVELWSKIYWTSWDNDYMQDIVTDSSDNIYVVGYTSGESTGFERRFFMIKYNQSGAPMNWTFGEEGISSCANAVTCDSNDNIYILGTINNNNGENYDLFLLKYDSSLNKIWSRSWGGFNDVRGIDIAIDSLDNLYILGITNNTGSGDYDLFLLNYSTTGVLLWNQTWGGTNNDYGEKILLDSSEELNILGSTEYNGNISTFLLKYNNSGVLLWNKTFFGNSYDHFALDSLDYYYFAQTGDYFEDEGTDIYVAMYNNSGNFESDLIWGGNLTDSCGDIAIDSFDNIYLTGCTRHNMILVKNPEDKTSYSPPGIFSLKVNTTEIGIKENFSLIWTNSRSADNYSIYVYDDYFRDIENPAILYEEGIINNNFTISELYNGVYFFLVASFNKNGYTVSNCVIIIVNTKSDTSQGIPIEFYYLLSIYMGIGIVYVIALTIISKRIFRSD